MLDLILEGWEVVSFVDHALGDSDCFRGRELGTGSGWGFGEANGGGCLGRLSDRADGCGMSEGSGYGNSNGNGSGDAPGRYGRWAWMKK